MSPEKLQHEFVLNLTQHQTMAGVLLQQQLNCKHLPIETQLGIYQRNYFGSIQKTLQQIYPACLRILGDDFFNTLCRDYLISRTSAHHDLNGYGDSFPKLLSTQCNINPVLQGYDYLTDMARLEWHWHDAYFSQNDPAFDFKNFEKLSPESFENVGFSLSHSLRLIKTPYPLLEIWNANRRDRKIKQDFIMPAQQQYYCIYRHQLELQIKAISQDMYLSIDSIKDNLNLQTLCESNLFDINQLLPKLIYLGWVCGYIFRD